MFYFQSQIVWILYKLTADFSQKLTTSCHEHLEKVIREQQQNYKLDPQLTLKCVNSVSNPDTLDWTHMFETVWFQIERLCPPKEGFNVVECLKKEYFEGTLSDDKTCMLVCLVYIFSLCERMCNMKSNSQLLMLSQLFVMS